MDTVIMELKENWRFNLGECEQAWYKGYDDSSWRRIMIPHDWSVEAPFSKDYSSGTAYLQGGIGWYRTCFILLEKYRGKRIRLVFDGVYKNSQVFCNSYYLGKRPCGYVSFSYDISDFAVFGTERNVISVKVAHTDIADSRWFTGSGITRKVTLLIEEAVHPAEHGVTFRTDKVLRQGENCLAQVGVLHEPVNTGAESVKLGIRTALFADEGEAVAEFTGEIELAPGEKKKLVLTGEVENPALWSPETPFLYLMRTWYQVGDGKPFLVNEEKVGIRTIEFLPDKGFLLNGVNMKIKGVCVHHDGGCLGAAMQPEVWQRRLELLKDCGCNAIRCSHNPHMPELYALCDAMGFLVMDEAFDEWENSKNKWTVGHNVYPPRHQGYYEDFPEWHEKDLRAMVRRDRNHPCVILWSIGNEIDYPNDPYVHPMFQTMTGNNDADKPAAERQYDANKPDMGRIRVIAGKLAAIVREEDKTRPVTLAAAFPELSAELGFFDALSVVGYNYKEHLYEKDHARFPDKTFLGSENSHSLEAWKAVTDNPYICGQFLWTGVDYLGEAKGWPVHGSPAGLLTTAGFPKPEYYRRKELWKEELSDDGGLLQEDASGDGRLLQEDASGDGGLLQEDASENEAIVSDRDACGAAENKSALSVTVWKHKDVVSGLKWERVSAKTGYLYQLLVSLTGAGEKKTVSDKVISEDREIKVQVQGSGELAGIDNGNLADVTPFSSQSRMTYDGNLAVYIRRTGTGPVRIFLQLISGQEDAEGVWITL